MRIGFIGTGNMGSAIVRGYADKAAADGNEICLFNRTPAKAEILAKECKAALAGGISELVHVSDVVFACVEPKHFEDVMPEVAESFAGDKIFVSIAAGVTIEFLESYLGSDAKIIRTMPNTPIMHGLGVTAMVRNKNVDDEDFAAVRKVFEAGGITGEVTEDLISAVIGVSGSSPAYTYMYIDALIKAGIDAGLDPKTSREFAAQAVKGAAQMVLASDEEPSVLCDKVCTPGGTTIEAVTKLKELGFEDITKSGAEAAIERSREMSRK